ncbi:MAG: ferredoxin [Acidimicrobiales bacterium]
MSTASRNVRARPRFSIQIDPIRCDGYGYCVELLPELMSFDDWGFPIVNEKTLTSREAYELAKRVEHLCPKLAFRVVDATG